MHKDRTEQQSVPPIVLATAQAAANGNQSSQPLHADAHSHTSSTTEDSHPTSVADPGAELLPIEQPPPPLYSDEYGRVDISQDGFNTKAEVAGNGRLDIRIDQKSRRFSDLVVPTLKSQLSGDRSPPSVGSLPPYLPPTLRGLSGDLPPPPLNLVVHVVGSRGDVQPFIALGKVLRESYGHRVRLATHSTFRTFVEENGLEFFDIGGDPAELMAFMVKNPGLMPGMDSLKSGDVGRRRKGMYEIMQGCWRSCYEIGDGTGVQASDETLSNKAGLGPDDMEVDPSDKPFVADAIIANPPSFAHIHCAERLGIPLHLMFTMPWSPTQAFPHPLANIESSNADTSLTNFVSYVLVEMMTWQGLGDMINRFREKSLSLEPLSLMYAPGVTCRLQVPYTYCWSPALIPKPGDWGPHVSVSGFYFLSLASSFSPDDDLQAFLDAGPPPIYIGFGSIVVDDPNAMTELIFDAVRRTGQRALVSKGWGGFGADGISVPDGVFMLGNVPHDWLFKRVSCVVHHGGAGTTAAGVALGRPTVIVPFFGDQPFWGAMIFKAGAGPRPIPNKSLTAENLATAITEALKPTTLARAQELGARISSEQGTAKGAQSFHHSLDLNTIRCSLAPSRTAVWRVKRTNLRLSAFAAATLGNEGLLDFNDLKLYRPKEHETENGPLEPFSGGASAILGTIFSFTMGAADIPVEALKALRIHPADKNIRPSSRSPAGKSSDSLNLSPSLRSDHGDSQSLKRSKAESNSLDSDAQGEDTQKNSVQSLSQVGAAEDEVEGSVRKEPTAESINVLDTSHRTTSSQHLSPERRRSSNHMTADAAIGAGKGVGRMVGAGVKSPMEFTLALARGFHNAPKLYGDEMVRPTDRVTDLQSGLRAAGKEFGFGFYDGVTGLVTQPLDGARKKGFAGFLKGFGKGIGGLMLKPAAAIWGLPGYTFKGVYKEIQKHFGTSVENYIVAARTSQGFLDWKASSREDRDDILKNWYSCQADIQKQKEQHRLFHPSTKQFKTSAAKTIHPEAGLHEDRGFEQAIKASVEATSVGDADQDRVIERALRVCVQEMRSAPSEDHDQAALDRAIEISIAKAKQESDKEDDGGKHSQELKELSSHRAPESVGNGSIVSDPGAGKDGPNHEYDADIERALESSRESHAAELKELEKSAAEEEIVLRYVQRLSALEDAQKDTK